MVDRALSTGQVQRRYGLAESALQASGLPLATAYLAPTRGSYRYRRVVFVVATRKLARLDPNSLRHLAGVAELRALLGVAGDAWRSAAAARYRPNTPDAFWKSERGTIAIEYDVGSYSRTQILAKARTFLAYASQIWGSSSLARTRHLQHLLEQTDGSARVLYAPWL
ncbi:MAG TPA: replication-relaxation family protein [Trueperaceae bacterium]